MKLQIDGGIEPHDSPMTRSLPDHWVEYAIEAAALGTFMVSAAVFTILLDHPRSVVPQLMPNPVVRRVLIGLAMGLTNIALIYSKPGRRSGAHMNPVVTLTFFRLGKVARPDAAGYIAAQFAGATAVMAALALVARPWLSDPAVNYVVTKPGPPGAAVAFAAEVVISFGMMLTVLTLSNQARLRRWTGVAAGILVAVYISVEAPLSGMSMNPARSFGPAIVSGDLMSVWLYFVAPLFGMLAAAELFLRRKGLAHVACAKLHHDAHSPCIFHCRYAPTRSA
jgi:aquaporin Z